MLISELSETTGAPVGTLKFYLREGLLPPGRAVNRTRAEYGESHVTRVRLITALTTTGGLSIARARAVIDQIDAPSPDPVRLMATAQAALLDALEDLHVGEGTSEHAPAERGDPDQHPAGARDASTAQGGREPGPGAAKGADEEDDATSRLMALGWRVNPHGATVRAARDALLALDDAGIPLGREDLRRYAESAHEIARVDLSLVPVDDPELAARTVVLGTVLVDPLLRALRLMAQQHEAITAATGMPDVREAASGSEATAIAAEVPEDEPQRPPRS